MTLPSKIQSIEPRNKKTTTDIYPDLKNKQIVPPILLIEQIKREKKKIPNSP